MNFDIASNYKMIQLNGTLALDEIQGLVHFAMWLINILK